MGTTSIVIILSVMVSFIGIAHDLGDGIASTAFVIARTAINSSDVVRASRQDGVT